LQTTVADVALLFVSMKGWADAGDTNPGADHV
jgi:hypothetical protein